MVKRLLFGVCCALGGLTGLWTAIWSVPTDEPQGTLGADLLKMAQPVLAHVGLGIVCGVALALGLLAAVQPLRKLRRAQRDEREPIGVGARP